MSIPTLVHPSCSGASRRRAADGQAVSPELRLPVGASNAHPRHYGKAQACGLYGEKLVFIVFSPEHPLSWQVGFQDCPSKMPVEGHHYTELGAEGRGVDGKDTRGHLNVHPEGLFVEEYSTIKKPEAALRKYTRAHVHTYACSTVYKGPENTDHGRARQKRVAVKLSHAEQGLGDLTCIPTPAPKFSLSWFLLALACKHLCIQPRTLRFGHVSK